MDYELTEEIKQILIKNNLGIEANKITDLISAGSTGGEITGMVGSYLNRLIADNVCAMELIGNKVKQFNTHAKSIGIDLI